MEKIKLLVADDSAPFRHVLYSLLGECPNIEIIAEAENGIEALQHLYSFNPDVVLLDLEMPLMDGMTALKHLMIHQPTPTIVFSSLTEEGTDRSFDTLKNGAVDFVSKDFLSDSRNRDIAYPILLDKINSAANISLNAHDLFNLPRIEEEKSNIHEKVIFCEECGGREVVVRKQNDNGKMICSQCGDTLFYQFDIKFYSNNCMTMFAGGAGSFNNFLDIIPSFESSLPGTIFCIIDAPKKHVDQFAKYLASISRLPTHRAKIDTVLEGGNCYIAASSDNFCVRSAGTSLKITNVGCLPDGVGPIDLLLASVSKVYKKKVNSVTLSGHGSDSIKGLKQIHKVGGKVIVIDSPSCLQHKTRKVVMENLPTTEFQISDLVDYIKEIHLQCDTGRMG